MRRDLLIGILVSLGLHAGFALGGQFLQPGDEQAPPPEEIPTLEVLTLPPLEPEPEEVDITELQSESAAAESSIAPTLTDMPSAVINSDFVQAIQPPPPPGIQAPTGVIAIPTARPGTGAPGTGAGLFDLNSLDQKPVPTFQARPVYPMDMRRAGVAGQVIVRFIVDTEGRVRDAQAISSTRPEFEQAAVQAVLKWKFKPGKKGGVAVNTSNVRVPIVFNLNDE